MGNTRLRFAMAVALVATTTVLPATGAGDAGRGEDLFDKRCATCHDPGRYGPPYKGVYGRKAGTVPGYMYSEALKSSGIVWDERSLEAWLADADTFVPGNRMGYRVKDARDRADVVEYLKVRK